MTARFVRSGGTGGAWTGTVVTTLTAGLAAPTALGDDIYIAADHVEPVSATAITYTSVGTVSIPCNIYVADHTVALVGGAPPASALIHTPTVLISTSGASGLTMAGIVGICEGLIFSSGSGANLAHIIFSGAWYLKNCNCILNNTSTTSTIRPTGTSAVRTVWDNVSVSFLISNQNIANQGGEFTWKNSVALLASSVVPSLGLFGVGNAGITTLRGVDLTNITTAQELTAAGVTAVSTMTLIGCKEPTGWGSANRAPLQTLDTLTVVGERVDTGAINYTKYKEDFYGTQTTDITVTRTGGATDGTTLQSWKIDTTTKGKAKPTRPFRSTAIAIWNDVTGTNRVVTIFGRGAGVPVAGDLWLEVEYMGSTASPLATVVSTAVISSDSSAWSGSTTSFKLATTLNAPQPAMKGPITIRICVGTLGLYYFDWQPVLS